MTLLHPSTQFSCVRFTCSRRPPSAFLRPRFHIVRSILPFPNQKAKYNRELEAAVDVVERACRLCVDVKSSTVLSDGRVLEKGDQTPVTVADFGVQALISLELGKLFPSIPLVAEEDSAFLRSNNLTDAVVSSVLDKTSFQDEPWMQDDVLGAIDRGGNATFGTPPATYWVLDPIDGTRGFLKGSDALYVVGLALVVEGEIVIGVMGCPNWSDDFADKSTANVSRTKNDYLQSGIIMVAHVDRGTWKKKLPYSLNDQNNVLQGWTRCFVDEHSVVEGARFCISDSQTWESLPLSALFKTTTNTTRIENGRILLLPTCCGSLCKYLMVATGRAAVFVLRAKSQTIKAWDHAVGIICVHEAGGKVWNEHGRRPMEFVTFYRVTDWEESEIDLSADRAGRRVIVPSGGVLATNGSLHDQIIEMTSSNSSYF